MLSTFNLQHLRYNFLEVIIFIYQGRGGGIQLGSKENMEELTHPESLC